MITAPNFAGVEGLVHGFGLRHSIWPPDIVTVKQIHSDLVLEAPGATDREGDALISNEPGVLVGVKTADCVPILLVDTSNRSVAAIHAGWRGSAGGISGKAVWELVRRWGSRPESIRAAIGPSIGGCCYQVGPEVARRFGIECTEAIHIDLRAINEMQLRQAGVSQIWKSDECTFCTPGRFSSFRREGAKAGRMLSFIGWQKDIGRIAWDPPGNSPRN